MLTSYTYCIFLSKVCRPERLRKWMVPNVSLSLSLFKFIAAANIYRRIERGFCGTYYLLLNFNFEKLIFKTWIKKKKTN